MSAHDVPGPACGDAPDSFDSPDGRTYSGPVNAAAPGHAAPDPIAEEVEREFDNWFGGEGYDDDGMFDADEMEFAFESGFRTVAERAAQVRPVSAVTVEALATVLASKSFPVRVGNGWELRTPARPHDLAVQLLSAIDAKLTDDKPAPELADDSGGYEPFIASSGERVIEEIAVRPAPEPATAMAKSDSYREALENVFAVLNRDILTYAERISRARTLIRAAREGK